MKPLYVLLALLALGSPAFAEGDHDEHHHDDHAEHAEHDDHAAHDDDDEPEHVFDLDGMEILHPWTRATDDDVAYLFMELHNEGEAMITLTGAHTEAGAKGGLIGFRMQGGDITFDAIPAFPLEPGQEIDLSPDGLAIRLEGVTRHLDQGDHWDVVLETSSGEIALEVAVEAEDARQHSHAGHAH